MQSFVQSFWRFATHGHAHLGALLLIATSRLTAPFAMLGGGGAGLLPMLRAGSMTGPVLGCPKCRIRVLNVRSYVLTIHSAVLSAVGGHGVETRGLDDPKKVRLRCSLCF